MANTVELRWQDNTEKSMLMCLRPKIAAAVQGPSCICWLEFSQLLLVICLSSTGSLFRDWDNASQPQWIKMVLIISASQSGFIMIIRQTNAAGRGILKRACVLRWITVVFILIILSLCHYCFLPSTFCYKFRQLFWQNNLNPWSMYSQIVFFSLLICHGDGSVEFSVIRNTL